MNALISNSLRRVGASLMTAVIVFAGLASLAIIDSAAAGKGGDNRAPAPRAAMTTAGGVSPHIEAINQNKVSPGNKTDEPCLRPHCNRPPHDHEH